MAPMELWVAGILAFGFILIYEGIALLTHRLPTVTDLSVPRPYLRVLLVVAVAIFLVWIIVHLYLAAQ